MNSFITRLAELESADAFQIQVERAEGRRRPELESGLKHQIGPPACKGDVVMLCDRYDLEVAQGCSVNLRWLSGSAAGRVKRSHTPEQAWARRVVDEGVRSYPRAGCRSHG